MRHETLIIGLTRAVAALAAATTGCATHDIHLGATFAGSDVLVHVRQVRQPHGAWSQWVATASWGAQHMARADGDRAETATELALEQLFAALLPADDAAEQAECGSSPRLDDTTTTLDTEGAP